jgi:hypothetical protein
VSAFETALCTLFDGAFGTRLESLSAECGLTRIQTHTEDTTGVGGSVAAEVMKRSAQKLRDAYLSSGAVMAEQLQSYQQLCDAPDIALSRHRTICAWGQRR